MNTITPRTACPQPSTPDVLASLPDPAASRRAWASLLASWQRRQADLAAGRQADARHEQKIEAARQCLVDGHTRAERVTACDSMKALIKVRSPEQVRRLEIERGLA